MPSSLITVTPSMIISAPNTGDPNLLFDGDVNTFWFPGWNSAIYPAQIVIDLLGNYDMDKIRIQDFEGMPHVQFSLAQGTQSNIVFSPTSLKLDGYGSWHEVSFNNTNADYVIIELLDVHSDKPMGQVELFGALTSTSSSGSGSGSGSGTSTGTGGTGTGSSGTGGSGTTNPTSTPGTASQIPITSNMIIPITNIGDPSLMFDGDTSTYWFPGWNASMYPIKVAIDLQSMHTIEKVRIYDNMGQPTLRMSFADPTITDIIGAPVEQVLDGFQSWKDVPINTNARFVIFEILSATSDKPIGDIEIHGYSNTGGTTTTGSGSGSGSGTGTGTGGNTGTSTPPVASALGAANVIGANSFHWVPMDVVGNLPWVREYQYWTWMEDTPGLNHFEPTAGGNGNYDTHYTELKSQGVTPIACINTTPTWMNDYPAGVGWNFDHKPKPYGSNGTNPMSYQALSRFMFQLAARYGRAVHPNSVLTVDTTSNAKRSGLDLLEYIEVWNEPDKWWKGTDAEFSAEEFAAMLSACYDGHEGALGAGYGIKTADPTMKVIMGGLSTLDTEYITHMDAWFKANRSDQVFCSEVLNFHHYSNSSPSLKYNGFDEGVSPEDDDLKNKLKAVVNFRDSNFPNKQVWISELGYDSEPTGQSSKPIGSHDMEEIQARWLVRTCLESIASGVDRIFIYNLTDTGWGQGLYNVSGLVGSEADGYPKKASWHKVMDLLNNINGYNFAGENCILPDAKMYAFNNGTDTLVYGWSPTSNNEYIELFHDTPNQIRLTENPIKIEINKGNE